VRSLRGKVLCDQRAASCRCREPLGHEDPHRCDPRCGGAWTGKEDDGTFRVVEFPQQGNGDLLTAMLTAPFMMPIPGLGADEDW